MKKQLSRKVIIREVLKSIIVGFAAGVFCSLLMGMNDSPVTLFPTIGAIVLGQICATLIVLTFFPQWVRK